MKFAIVFGTRPEIIKLAPLFIKGKEMGVDVKFVCTGQHREMVDMMKGVFNVESDFDMGVMTPNQTPNAVASKVFERFEEYAKAERFDWVLVQGDTTTAMAVALAAFNLGMRVGHVEAGLRSGCPRDPFPEEMNRRVIDQVSDILFAPTRKAELRLLKEGFDSSRIRVTGNTVVDAQLFVAERFELESFRNRVTDQENYFLVTLHRRENIGERMRGILRAIRRFSSETGLHFVLPVHKNPNVRKIVLEEVGDFEFAQLVDPVDYVTLQALLKFARFVATDSGGIQEEAPTFGKFVVVCRETTERPELLEEGFGVLAGTEERSVYFHLHSALSVQVPRKRNPFGDGKASERIWRALLELSR